MTSPSPLVQDAWIQWADRGTLMRRDVSLVLGGCYGKNRFLKDLREKIYEHRRDDLVQLDTARRESWTRWDERLVRLERWIASAGTLGRASSGLLVWRDAAQWFDRAQAISRRYIVRWDRKTEPLEIQVLDLVDRLKSWGDRLKLQETELREIFERQAAQSQEVLVLSTRKRTYLDFVYAEREEEGRLALSLARLSRQSSRALERLSAVEQRLTQKADTSPAYFEFRKRQILDGWRSLQKRLAGVSETSVNQGLVFEEGRQRLRWIYEKIQRMRVLPDAPSQPRPFLHRLFNVQDE